MLDDGMRSYQAEREQLREFVGRVTWTHFVTLTFNDPTVRVDWMKGRLSEWDKRVNRRMIGTAYRRKLDQRILWMAFPEKIGSNPHWHLVLQLTDEQLAAEEAAGRKSFCSSASDVWQKLVPSGTIDIRPVENKGINEYTTKAASLAVNFENFVHSRQVLKL